MQRSAYIYIGLTIHTRSRVLIDMAYILHLEEIFAGMISDTFAVPSMQTTPPSGQIMSKVLTLVELEHKMIRA